MVDPKLMNLGTGNIVAPLIERGNSKGGWD